MYLSYFNNNIRGECDQNKMFLFLLACKMAGFQNITKPTKFWNCELAFKNGMTVEKRTILGYLKIKVFKCRTSKPCMLPLDTLCIVTKFILQFSSVIPFWKAIKLTIPELSVL